MLTEAREARLSELAALSDGWLDGSGVAISPDCLNRAREFMTAGAHLRADRYSIFPTEAGGVLLEDFGKEHSVSIEFSPGAIDVWAADTQVLLASKQTLIDTTATTVTEAVAALAAALTGP